VTQSINQSKHISIAAYVASESEAHSRCDVRPMVTFPALEHHRPSTSTKLYCLATKANLLTTCL